MGRVSAAADIAINNAKVNGSNTVLVTFDDPGQNIASVDFSKWHIDVGDGGATPLNPASAAVTSAGTPWTVTLTFAAGSFSDTATAYGAAVGLYVDASGVTDTNADTNAVVGHAASIAITDGQAPTFTSASATSNTNIRIVMSETMAGGTVTFGAANQWTATG
ncbi:hypothetical protein HZA38_03665, partial [Candidatus Peregrinibacteria bacterium]|nr:hypothetical protein [Candidatus Peregrinibacteria bacterium]